MKMARTIILMTLLLFNFILVPSMAFPSDGALGFGPRNNDDWHFKFSFPFTHSNDEQPAQDEQPNPVVPNKDTNLKMGFYSQSCPNAEKIVSDAFAEIFKTNPNAIANIIRLQFHDCFVAGCDASILLDYAPSGDKVEKSSLFNGQLLKGVDIIDDIKTKLEEECPGIVSCADTLAFTTHEAMALGGITRQRPLGGRRDATVSLASVAEDNNLPLPNWNVNQMIDLFNKKGFNPEEMVILLGAHSVGAAHCEVFMDRMYNFQNTKIPDPTLPQAVLDELRQMCPNPGTPQFRNPPVNFDETPAVLDNLFYRNLVEKNKSLLMTDAVLLNDPRTAPAVKQMADDPALFQRRFAELMVRLNSLNVITGTDGEVRKTCRSVN